MQAQHRWKVVLSTSAYVPREIPGILLMEWVDELHQWNPGQLATATLVHTIDKALLYPQQPTYQLSSSDRIVHLEAELFALKARRSNFVSLVRTRAQTARRAQVELSDEEDIPAPKKIAPPKVIAQPTERELIVDSGPVPIATPHITTVEAKVIVIEHPFRNAKDTAYTPPTDGNIGAPAPQANKKSEPAYKQQQPAIYKASITTDVYSRTMDTLITVTQQELLSLSPDVRAQIREAITTRRIVAQGNQEQPSEAVNFLWVEDSDDKHEPEIPMILTFAIPNIQHHVPLEGVIIIPDPIETYVKSLPPGTAPDPDRLIVGCENAAVCSVFALVDNNCKKECILDLGCQVITISKAVSHELAIAYDLTFCISMQSANGELDMLFGLARNVPFKIGPVTFYLQAHVIDSNTYDVLLGQPFDVLTESVIRNFAN